MDRRIAGVVDRRYAVGGIVAATAALVMPRQLRIRAITQRGMMGGGLVGLEGREAQFSLFASRYTFDDEESNVVVGSVRWSDLEAGYALASTEVTAYDIVDAEPERGEVRRIAGTMTVNDADSYPFTMTLIDAGGPGAGLDSIALVVGDGVAVDDEGTPVSGLGFSYTAVGAVAIGDLQDVDFEIPLAGAGDAAAGATPTP